MKNLLLSLALCFLASTSLVFAQPRPAEKPQTPKTAPRMVVPESFQAKYEGGMLGFDKKLEGTLKFDDTNERLVFFGQDQKEKFSIAYDAMLSVYTGKKSVRSAAGTAISVIPLPGAGLAGLIREKRRYLVIHYSDQAVEARGVTSFKIESDQIRESVIETLGEKANLTKRGDAYVRAKTAAKTNDQ